MTYIVCVCLFLFFLFHRTINLYISILFSIISKLVYYFVFVVVVVVVAVRIKAFSHHYYDISCYFKIK